MTEERHDLERREAIDDLLDMSHDIKRLVELLKDIEGFLKIIATIGKVLKWTAGLLAACLGVYAAYKGINK